jgi:hypothetical protein
MNAALGALKRGYLCASFIQRRRFNIRLVFRFSLEMEKAFSQ